MTVRLRTELEPENDPRRQPGAYINHGRQLYEVIEPAAKGALHVLDARTDCEAVLTEDEVMESALIRRAPTVTEPSVSA